MTGLWGWRQVSERGTRERFEAAVTSSSERVAPTQPFVCESARLRHRIGSQTGTGCLDLMPMFDTDTIRSIC
jgi:hypothetical protein